MAARLKSSRRGDKLEGVGGFGPGARGGGSIGLTLWPTSS